MSQSGPQPPQPPQPPQHHTVTVLPLGVTLSLAPGQSLLEAALAAGLVLRSACRNGTCRECIARVVQGTVHHRIPWPGLSADEKAEGWVLPCVAVADSDVTLLQPKVDAAGYTNK